MFRRVSLNDKCAKQLGICGKCWSTGQELFQAADFSRFTFEQLKPEKIHQLLVLVTLLFETRCVEFQQNGTSCYPKKRVRNSFRYGDMQPCRCKGSRVNLTFFFAHQHSLDDQDFHGQLRPTSQLSAGIFFSYVKLENSRAVRRYLATSRKIICNCTRVYGTWTSTIFLNDFHTNRRRCS